MLARAALAKLITAAFADVPYPGNDDLIESRLSEEALQVEAEFRGCRDWRILSEVFLDQAPGGLGSALTFFSDGAFHFYIAAYMLADLDGKMTQSDPLYHLAPQSMDPRVSGFSAPFYLTLGTWGRATSLRICDFTQDQRFAVAQFLKYRSRLADISEEQLTIIEHTVEKFWLSNTKI
jgi:hypothetical protein